MSHRTVAGSPTHQTSRASLRSTFGHFRTWTRAAGRFQGPAASRPAGDRTAARCFFRPVKAPVTLMVAANDTEPTFNPGIPRPLFEGPYRLGFGTNPWPYAVSPDGQRFLMIKEPADAGEAAGADIVLVQNWFEELTRLVPIP